MCGMNPANLGIKQQDNLDIISKLNYIPNRYAKESIIRN